MKEKLSTTGMGTHSPHSFWNGKLAFEVFFGLFGIRFSFSFF